MKKFGLFAGLFVFLGVAAWGQDVFVFNNNNTGWNIDARWSKNGASPTADRPKAGDTVRITGAAHWNTGAGGVPVGLDMTGYALTCSDLTIETSGWINNANINVHNLTIANSDVVTFFNNCDVTVTGTTELKGNIEVAGMSGTPRMTSVTSNSTLKITSDIILNKVSGSSNPGIGYRGGIITIDGQAFYDDPWLACLEFPQIYILDSAVTLKSINAGNRNVVILVKANATIGPINTTGTVQINVDAGINATFSTINAGELILNSPSSDYIVREVLGGTLSSPNYSTYGTGTGRFYQLVVSSGDCGTDGGIEIKGDVTTGVYTNTVKNHSAFSTGDLTLPPTNGNQTYAGTGTITLNGKRTLKAIGSATAGTGIITANTTFIANSGIIINGSNGVTIGGTINGSVLNGIVELISSNNSTTAINISGNINAYQLKARAPNGTVAISGDVTITGNSVKCGESAPIFIHAEGLNVTGAAAASINPGTGQLCLTVDIINGDLDTIVGPQDTTVPPSATGPGWHKHSASVDTRHLVYSTASIADGSPFVDKTGASITLSYADYNVVTVSDVISSGDIVLNVQPGKNIYLIDVTSSPSLTFSTSGTGAIVVRGNYNAPDVTLNPGTGTGGGIILDSANIVLGTSSSFNTTGVTVNLRGTNNYIEANNIILGNVTENSTSFSLKSGTNIALNGTVSSSSTRIRLEAADNININANFSAGQLAAISTGASGKVTFEVGVSVTVTSTASSDHTEAGSAIYIKADSFDVRGSIGAVTVGTGGWVCFCDPVVVSKDINNTRLPQSLYCFDDNKHLVFYRSTNLGGFSILGFASDPDCHLIDLATVTPRSSYTIAANYNLYMINVSPTVTAPSPVPIITMDASGSSTSSVHVRGNNNTNHFGIYTGSDEIDVFLTSAIITGSSSVISRDIEFNGANTINNVTITVTGDLTVSDGATITTGGTGSVNLWGGRVTANADTVTVTDFAGNGLSTQNLYANTKAVKLNTNSLNTSLTIDTDIINCSINTGYGQKNLDITFNSIGVAARNVTIDSVIPYYTNRLRDIEIYSGNIILTNNLFFGGLIINTGTTFNADSFNLELFNSSFKYNGTFTHTGILYLSHVDVSTDIASKTLEFYSEIHINADEDMGDKTTFHSENTFNNDVNIGKGTVVFAKDNTFNGNLTTDSPGFSIGSDLTVEMQFASGSTQTFTDHGVSGSKTFDTTGNAGFKTTLTNTGGTDPDTDRWKIVGLAAAQFKTDDDTTIEWCESVTNHLQRITSGTPVAPEGLADNGGYNKNVFKIVTYTWIGAESSDWDEDDNWLDEEGNNTQPPVDASYTEIIIPSSALYDNELILDSAITCGTLTILAGGAIDLANISFNARAATDPIKNAGTIKLQGVANQVRVGAVPAPTDGATVGGIIQYTSSSTDWVFGDDYVNLIVDSGSSSSMASAGALTVTGTANIASNISATSVSVTGASTIGANITTTSGTQTYTGEVTVTAASTLTGSTVIFKDEITGGTFLTVSGNLDVSDPNATTATGTSISFWSGARLEVTGTEVNVTGFTGTHVPPATANKLIANKIVNLTTNTATSAINIDITAIDASRIDPTDPEETLNINLTLNATGTGRDLEFTNSSNIWQNRLKHVTISSGSTINLNSHLYVESLTITGNLYAGASYIDLCAGIWERTGNFTQNSTSGLTFSGIVVKNNNEFEAKVSVNLADGTDDSIFEGNNTFKNPVNILKGNVIFLGNNTFENTVYFDKAESSIGGSLHGNVTLQFESGTTQTFTSTASLDTTKNSTYGAYTTILTNNGSTGTWNIEGLEASQFITNASTTISYCVSEEWLERIETGGTPYRATDGGNNINVFGKVDIYRWTGASTTAWDLPGNWNTSLSATFPIPNDAVIIIPSIGVTREPVFVDDVECASLEIQAGRTLDIGEYELSIASASLSNAGTIRLHGNSLTQVQINTLTTPANPSGSTVGGTIEYYNPTPAASEPAFWVFGNSYVNLTVDSGLDMDSAGALIVTGTAKISSDINATSVAFSGDVEIGAYITTGGVQSYGTTPVPPAAPNTVTLTGDVVLTGTNITFNSTIDGAYNLTISSTNAVFTNAVGTTNALSSLNVTSDASIGAPSITTATAGTVSLNATGTITQTGIITTSVLNLTATGAITLDQDNVVNAVSVTECASFNFVNTGTLDITEITTTTPSAATSIIKIANTGDINVNGNITGQRLALIAPDDIITIDADAEITTNGSGNCTSGAGPTHDDTTTSIYFAAAKLVAPGTTANIVPGGILGSGHLCLVNVEEFEKDEMDARVDGKRYHPIVYENIFFGRYGGIGIPATIGEFDLEIDLDLFPSITLSAYTASGKIVLYEIGSLASYDKSMVFTVRSGGTGIEIYGDYTSSNDLTLINNGTGDILLKTDAVISVRNLTLNETVNGGNNDLTITTSGTTGTVFGGAVSNVKDLTVTSNGSAIEVGAPITADKISLTTTGNITQATDAIITANTLTLNATGLITLDQANKVSVLGTVQGQGFRFTNTVALTTSTITTIVNSDTNTRIVRIQNTGNVNINGNIQGDVSANNPYRAAFIAAGYNVTIDSAASINTTSNNNCSEGEPPLGTPAHDELAASIFVSAQTFTALGTVENIYPGITGELCVRYVNNRKIDSIRIEGERYHPKSLSSIEFARIMYSFAEDANGNGILDRIRVQVNVIPNGNFTGYRVEVKDADGNSIKDTGFGIVEVHTGNPDDADSFYIFLEENSRLYDGRTVSWRVTQNTSLEDSDGNKIGDSSDGITYKTINTIPPRISYALALPGHNEIFVKLSQPVQAFSPETLTGTYSFGSIRNIRAVSTEPVPSANLEYIAKNNSIANFRLRDGYNFAPSAAGTTSFILELDTTPSVTQLAEETAVFALQGLRNMAVRALDWACDKIDPADYENYKPPRYPVNWNYNEYAEYIGNSHAVSASGAALSSDDPANPARDTEILVPPYSLLVSNHRAADILISLEPSTPSDPNYFAWPTYAKVFDDTNTIWNFDGTRILNPSTRYEMQVRSNVGLDAVIMRWGLNVGVEYRNPPIPAQNNSIRSGGLWLPDGASIVPMFYSSAPASTAFSPATAPDGTTLKLFEITGTSLESGGKFEFFFKHKTATDLNIARLDAPKGTIPANWYELVRPFQFGITMPRMQTGGVTILNNVINSDKREETFIRYRIIRPGRVTVQVYTLDGTLIKSIQRNEQKEPGEHTVGWDGTNTRGLAVTRGIYYVRVTGPDIDEIRKVMVIK